MPELGYVGLGVMGTAISRRLLDAGHTLTVWNRTREKAEPLAEDGATVCDAAAEAAQRAEIVLTVLADADATAETVEEIEFADGAVWVQAATVGVDGAERLAELAREKGVAFVDAPVLGTRQPAEEGKLVVLASGSAARAYAAIGGRAPVVSIGPQTSHVAASVGLTVIAEAASHDLDGLVAAVDAVASAA